MTNEMKLLQARKMIYEVVRDIYNVDPDSMLVFVHHDSINISVHDGRLSYEVSAREEGHEYNV